MLQWNVDLAERTSAFSAKVPQGWAVIERDDFESRDNRRSCVSGSASRRVLMVDMLTSEISWGYLKSRHHC